jgi:hypothetical protein
MALVHVPVHTARADEPRKASSEAASDLASEDPPEGTPEPPPEARTPAFELGLSLENDNLLLGLWASLAGIGADGSDLGRTHGAALWTSYEVDERLTLNLEVRSELYTRSLSVDRPQLGMTVPVIFREMDTLRVGAGLRAPGRAWKLRMGVGLEVANDQWQTIGATGQQTAWHDFIFGQLGSGWGMAHYSDGLGVRAGATSDVALGGRLRHALTSWLTLDARGFAGIALHSIFTGSALVAEGRIALSFESGRDVRFMVALASHASEWLAHAGMLLRSTIEMTLDLNVAVLKLELHRYDFDQNVAHYAYVFANTTMQISLSMRL